MAERGSTDLTEFLTGLDEDHAKELAEEEFGKTVRIVKRDEQSFVKTHDLRDDRLNFEITNGKVTRCYRG